MKSNLTSESDAEEVADVRSRVLSAAAGLIATGGREATTTRAVALAAGVQAPTIYRLFGDKRGLLDAVAQNELAAYVAAKALREPHSDPVQDLRDGWDMHVAFGTAHPDLYRIMSSDVQASALSPDIANGQTVLRTRLRAVALAGRLRVSEDRAVALLQTGCAGTVFTLLGQPVEQRDTGLSEAAREAVIGAITTEATDTLKHGPKGAAVALRAGLDQIFVLSAGEKHLLEELLDRIADGLPRA